MMCQSAVSTTSKRCRHLCQNVVGIYVKTLSMSKWCQTTCHLCHGPLSISSLTQFECTSPQPNVSDSSSSCEVTQSHLQPNDNVGSDRDDWWICSRIGENSTENALPNRTGLRRLVRSGAKCGPAHWRGAWAESNPFSRPWPKWLGRVINGYGADAGFLRPVQDQIFDSSCTPKSHILGLKKKTEIGCLVILISWLDSFPIRAGASC